MQLSQGLPLSGDASAPRKVELATKTFKTQKEAHLAARLFDLPGYV